MEKNKIWFITGASKGMGLALTKLVLANGDKVVATSRNIASLKDSIPEGNDDNFLALQLDITSDGETGKAIALAVGHFGRLDVVVNNAGYSLVGSLEETSDDEFRKTIDVNLFGVVNVLRNALQYLRQQQSGSIINISSNTGYVGFANAASYNAAKFGIIGISEALALEVQRFNVKVTVVAPGQFRTNFMDEGSMVFSEKKIEVYGTAGAEKMWRDYSGQQMGDPEKLVDILYSLAGMEKPPLHLLLGPDTYDLVTVHREKEKEEIEAWKHLTLSTNFS